MTAVLVQDDEETEQDSDNTNYESREEWLKNRIGFNTRYLEDLRHERQQKSNSEDIEDIQDNSESGLSDGKRAWYDREIRETEERISDIHEQLKEVSA
jgi:hypothetical protein